MDGVHGAKHISIPPSLFSTPPSSLLPHLSQVIRFIISVAQCYTCVLLFLWHLNSSSVMYIGYVHGIVSNKLFVNLRSTFYSRKKVVFDTHALTRNFVARSV
uniref:Transmembrane protein n=1 Tax=Arundo donax TaxID=35708 RepID=A0A0A9BZQ4_ARUDO